MVKKLIGFCTDCCEWREVDDESGRGNCGHARIACPPKGYRIIGPEDDDVHWEPVTLRPGDYVLTADIKDEAEFIKIQDAFVTAGANAWWIERGSRFTFSDVKYQEQECLGWDTNGSCNAWDSVYSSLYGLRQLTVAQVLGTTKPAFTPTPGWKLTRDGRKAYVGYVREDGIDKPLVGHIEGKAEAAWTLSGYLIVRDSNHFDNTHPYDLVSNYVESPLEGEVWVNIYEGKHLTVHNSEEAAKKAKGNSKLLSRVSIPWKEGQI